MKVPQAYGRTSTLRLFIIYMIPLSFVENYLPVKIAYDPILHGWVQIRKRLKGSLYELFALNSPKFKILKQ